jgi:hypothetical protein
MEVGPVLKLAAVSDDPALKERRGDNRKADWQAVHVSAGNCQRGQTAQIACLD